MMRHLLAVWLFLWGAISAVTGSSSSATTTTTASMSLLSSSNAKQGAMSSVLNDLEAEGCTKVATLAFLTSRSVSIQQRAQLLQALFNVEVGADITAVAIKSTDTDTTATAGEQEVGFALSIPSYSVSDAATAVQTCGGIILYAVHWNDVQRGGLEGVFDLLTPAIERMIAASVDNTNRAKLVVLFVGLPSEDNASTEQATQLFQQAATTSFAHMSTLPFTSLQQVFQDGVYFYSSITSIPEFIQDTSSFWKDLPTALADVTRSSSTFTPLDLISSTSKILATSPADLAAVRRLLPLSRQVLQQFMDAMAQASETPLDASNGFKDMKPMDTFGELADAAIQQSLDSYDTQANTIPTAAKSNLARRIRSHLITDIHSTILLMYEVQLEQLYLGSMEGFKAGLSKLRISPNLGSDMNQVAKLTLASFQVASKKLLPKALSSTSLAVPSASLLLQKLGKELREFISLRLLAARADGKFKPLPRKGVTVGFHWLLPKPFGNDYRQEPWMVHTKDDLTYVPKDKITDVAKEDILGTTDGDDWTRKIIPCPAANEMIYMK